MVEKNKKRFKGVELIGKSLGVIGLGAIGIKVANAGLSMGLDVQGYEWQLIKGGKKTIQNNLPLILLESNPERSKYDKKVLDFLKDLGYSNYRYLINTNEDCILINRNSDRYTQAIDIIEQMNEEYNLTKEF